MEFFEVVVVGLGGHGSAAVAQLAAATAPVLGLDQFPALHTKGSSHGLSRITRQAYFEHPSYVPLLRRATALWQALQATHGDPAAPLLRLCGGLMIGAPETAVVAGALASAQLHGLPHELLTPAAVAQRFPGFCLAPEEVAVYEPNAGVLVPERCVAAHLRMAQTHGAELRFGERLVSFDPLGDVVVVTTDQRQYRCRQLVLAVGAWAPQVYGAALPFPLTIERRVLFWFDVAHDAATAAAARDWPVFIWELPRCGDNFYGFPAADAHGLKLAMHSQRDAAATPLRQPQDLTEDVDVAEEEAMRAVADGRLPRLGRLLRTATCMYTTTPDRHFVIDVHPASARVLLVSPCSGHGFKFCSVVGEIVKQLVVDGRCDFDLSLFRLRSRADAQTQDA